jgi:hypothetical protein
VFQWLMKAARSIAAAVHGSVSIPGLFFQSKKPNVISVFAIVTCIVVLQTGSTQAAALFGPSSSGFISVNPAMGAETILNPIVPPGVACCGSAFDPATHTMFFISTDGLWEVDTRTGTLLRKVTLSNPPGQFVFDPGTGKLYGPASSGFVSVDPATGTETVLDCP